jgi:aspartate-semialdehyde dehydrogenase
MSKIKVGILGATGMVGQRLVQLLDKHPWFEIAALVASDRSAGKPYKEACNWKMDTDIPDYLQNKIVDDTKPNGNYKISFSGLPAEIAGDIEQNFAKAGCIVVSNSKNHRMLDNVPLLIPEVNPEHLQVVEKQKARWGNSGGYIITNANCIAIPLVMAAAPIHQTYGIEKIFVVTLQAVSGAGYPGCPSMDILDNVIPFIGGEEPKIETETQKMLGAVANDKIISDEMIVSSMVNRVSVVDGHSLSASFKLKKKADLKDIEKILADFKGEPQRLHLPSAPEKPIIVRHEENRPQPRLDRNSGKGMSVVVGRIRPCSIFDVKMNIMGHNTIRGAAGAAILNAELLKAKGYLE